MKSLPGLANGLQFFFIFALMIEMLHFGNEERHDFSLEFYSRTIYTLDFMISH